MECPKIPANGQELETCTRTEEPVFVTFCMMCENNKSYLVDDDIPESCPQCGEHKEFSIMSIDSLKGNF